MSDEQESEVDRRERYLAQRGTSEGEAEWGEPLEVPSPEHAAFEREIQDRQSAADVEREGDDFDKPYPAFNEPIYLAHPIDAAKFPQRVHWTDERLPRGKIYIKSGDDPRSIERYIRAVIAEDAFRYDGFAMETLRQYGEQMHWSGIEMRRYAPEAFEALQIALTQLAEHRDDGEWVVYTEGLITGTLRKNMG